MTDIVAIETAKAREQAALLYSQNYQVYEREHVTTALLEAKADALDEVKIATPRFSPWDQLRAFIAEQSEAIRREATCRKLRGL